MKDKHKFSNPAQLKEHFEIKYNPLPEGKVDSPRDAFKPMKGKDRPHMHNKINECDH